MYSKQRFLYMVSVFAVTITFLVFCSNKRPSSGDGLMLKVMSQLKANHYSPISIDDKFSERVFDNFLQKLDDDKRFFTATDIEKLAVYKDKIDDQIKSGQYTFFDSAWSMLMRRLTYIEGFYGNILDKPFDFKVKETYMVEEKVEKYPANEEALKEEWRKWLKFNALDRLYRKNEAQKNKVQDSTGAAKVLPFDSLEVKSRAETKKFCDDWFRRWRKMDRRDQLSFYTNCVTEIFDPHTGYFPPEDKKNFDIGMTGKLEGIGATLREADGYIKVERIVPGSASYKQGDLKAGDLILKVGQGSADPVDVVDMKLDDAIQLIRGKKGTEVRLTVKKPDGSMKVIPIVRDVVVIEESYARSAMVEYSGLPYGIINLPSFYADFNDRGRGRHSSKDVEIEIAKLKRAGAKGIILDLRNNGGGSLTDAIEMVGLFVKTGPVVQVRNSGGDATAYKDDNEKVSYDGPLVVLTNNFSASASEIVAAALQDYGRAVVVGTKSTFGKGTVQTFIPLGSAPSNVFPDGYGSLKVTIQKFYRINGGTTQLNGVVPDVIIPDMYDGIDLGEKELKFHMPYDKIAPASYKKVAGSYTNKLSAGIKNGKVRIGKEEHFKMVKSRAEHLKKVRKSFTWSLNFEEYAKQQQKLKEDEKQFSDSAYKSYLTLVKPLESDIEEVEGDATRKAQRTEWMKPYRKDAALDQAVMVLNDITQ